MNRRRRSIGLRRDGAVASQLIGKLLARVHEPAVGEFIQHGLELLDDKRVSLLEALGLPGLGRGARDLNIDKIRCPWLKADTVVFDIQCEGSTGFVQPHRAARRQRITCGNAGNDKSTPDDGVLERSHNVAIDLGQDGGEQVPDILLR